MLMMDFKYSINFPVIRIDWNDVFDLCFNKVPVYYDTKFLLTLLTLSRRNVS